jgi:hypothetical protein
MRVRFAGLVASALFMAALPATAQTPAPLDEAALAALIPGSMMTATNARGQRFEETYAPGGRLQASSTRTDGTCCISDSGRWSIELGQFCRQYDNWGDRQRFCHPISRTASGYVNPLTGRAMEFSRP